MSGEKISIGWSRRSALSLGLAGGLAAGAAGGVSAQPSAPVDGGVCLLTPQATQGPYWFDPKLERSDITEGRAGIPLKIAIRVVEGATCAPLAGARVDIWHCDAQGVYSGYAGQGPTCSTEGETFLRGHQPTDRMGLAAFTTVYPGWYQGRTTHIHVKVFLDEGGETNVLTCQLFFPDALSEWLYENAPAYARPGQTRDTLNATDMIAEGQGRSTFGFISEQADHYAMTVTLGVDRAARSAEGGFGPGVPGGHRGMGPPPEGFGPGMGSPPEGGGPPGGRGGPPGSVALTGEVRVAAMIPKAKA